MTKVTGPFFTFTVSGTYGNVIQLMKWRSSPFRKEEERTGIAYVRVRRLPGVSKTPVVLSIRDTLAAGVSIWHAEDSMCAESRNAWEASACALAMSGFNRYLQVFIENNPQRKPPWEVPSPQ